MAAKVKMLKLLQEIRGFAQIANRQPPPRSPGLILTQLRAHGTHESVRRRKLSVSFDKQTQPDLPHRVRINHVKPSPEPAAGLRTS